MPTFSCPRIFGPAARRSEPWMSLPQMPHASSLSSAASSETVREVELPHLETARLDKYCRSALFRHAYASPSSYGPNLSLRRLPVPWALGR